MPPPMPARSEPCSHPLATLECSPYGTVICRACAFHFASQSGTRVVLDAAREAVVALEERLEHFETAVAEQLDLYPCQQCGCWFRRTSALGSTRGVHLMIGCGDIYLCRLCVGDWYAARTERPEYQLEIDRGLARWFVAHRLEALLDGLNPRQARSVTKLRGQLQAAIATEAVRAP